MQDQGSYLPGRILDEGNLRIQDFQEEICFSFWKNLVFALAGSLHVITVALSRESNDKSGTIWYRPTYWSATSGAMWIALRDLGGTLSGNRLSSRCRPMSSTLFAVLESTTTPRLPCFHQSR